ncbi:uncharacterized protein BO66DRAFT_409972 [Aspergillus aculeatinus CBS 121060]|uniref:Uncharacterized protein n=1 Tax=Aspergillus aculeatinus CBS 121060 TaxID=1448322 RepID=A0ACD1HEC9_9EURO|nr:hypothetical protein BO66DRAFT_409972 [Aspergillus aculeatinus CBS 121060]RAH71869.1 hypothetical protein BO66DRAFT_409972 [Aspergillus aculeatinus CBS 121060]
MLDEIHPTLETHPNDKNAYTLGAISGHNVVIACLPAGTYGTTSAATVASSMVFTFGSMQHLLMVGIGGGVPSESNDVRLGDVVVSVPTPGCEGVIQYDYGKTIQEGHFERTGTLSKPSTSLLAARTCVNCDANELILRSARKDTRPAVHYGLIASGNQVIKHAGTRDRLAAKLDILCFEMEAAGLMDNFPCLVIRGISDYADSHKNKQWQGYAAATAAAYAKELLAVINATGPRIARESTTKTTSGGVDHRRCVIDALRFEQIESRQATIKAAHAKTCRWLLEKQEYLDWLDTDKVVDHHGFLWIKGKAGSGKSTIMKFAYQHAQAARDDNIVIVSFFFNARGEQLERTTEGMYRSLLLQLMEAVPNLQVLLDRVPLPPNHNSQNSSILEIERLQEIFRCAVTSLDGKHLICFIDALDECDVEQVRAMVEFLESLGQYATLSQIKLHVCFSSRQYPFITVENGIELILHDQKGHGEDIARYLRSELKIGRSKQADLIRTEISGKASGIFLWTVLVVQILNREYERGRLHALRKRLSEIPNELGELFKDILTRDNANLDQLLLCIQWVLFSKRPLRREELYFAILSGQPDDLSDAWDPDDITLDDMERFILATSKGLTETTKSRHATVQFIHESVREFLLRGNGIRELWPGKHDRLDALSHDRLKMCCQNYLTTDIRGSLGVPDELPIASSESARDIRSAVISRYPFFQYAVSNVLYHADAAQNGGVDQSEFIDRFPLTEWIHHSNMIEQAQIRRYTSSASLLYILAEHDLPNLIGIVLVDTPDLQIAVLLLATGRLPSDSKSQHLLLCQATDEDRPTVVDFLLRVLKVHPDGCGSGPQGTPLRLAIELGREHIFSRLLADCRVNLDRMYDEDGLTPLACACTEGRLAFVRDLLASERIQCDRGAWTGRTPLSFAADKGHLEIVRLLLKTGKVRIDNADKEGWTPLLYACLHGHSQIACELLSTGQANPNHTGLDLSSPLILAAKRPIGIAVKNGRADIARLLLATGRVDVNVISQKSLESIIEDDSRDFNAGALRDAG